MYVDADCWDIDVALKSFTFILSNDQERQNIDQNTLLF